MQIPSFQLEQSQLANWFSGRSIEQIIEQFEDEGYVVFDRVLDEKQIADIRAELEPWLQQNIEGRNVFEGVKSNRIYGMLNKSPKFAELITHPLLLPFAEAELGTSCLLSACLAIQLNPGETVQPWHYDDAHLEIPRPRRAYGLSAFWAIDKTDETNGATEIIPGSHKWEGESIKGSLKTPDLEKGSIKALQEDQGDHPDAIKVLMEAGSLMIAKGTLWHRGGANTSNKPRLIITPQFCPGWARQLENMLLAVSPGNAAKLPQRVQELIGYNIHPPFMGYVDGMHPQRTLLEKPLCGADKVWLSGVGDDKS
ncbi:MAG: phytanoyl-CoA dioxygenase family protein [Arenicella sp.]|nr:phytanoyl-CoA dioxygenase family protein [Arenicella sp.]